MTELIPMPALQPKPLPIQLTPAGARQAAAGVKFRYSSSRKLVVPHEIRARSAASRVEAPKVVVNNLQRPQSEDAWEELVRSCVHTGDFFTEVRRRRP